MSAQLKFTYWPLAKLKPQTKINPRAHTEQHVAELAAVIERYGFRIPILVDKKGRVVAGHRRLLAAKRLKLKSVPVVMASDLDDDAQRAFMIADNKVARLSQREAWDDAKLVEAMKYLEKRGYAPEAMAFTDDDVKRLIEDLEGARADRMSHGADGMQANDSGNDDDDGDHLDGGEGQKGTFGISLTVEDREELQRLLIEVGRQRGCKSNGALMFIVREWNAGRGRKQPAKKRRANKS